MKKIIYSYLMILAILLMGISCDQPDVYNYTIKNGVSFGHSIGYSYKEITIDSEMIYFTTKGNNEELHPPVTFQEEIKREEFTALCEMVDLEAFENLPERIGCPDCYDQGAEWVEISYPGYSKRVTFSYNETVPEIINFIEKLRTIRVSFK